MDLQFGRLLTAMVTPFSPEGGVDYVEVVRLADHLIATGTDTLVVCGTTGESPTLTHDEEFELFRILVQACKGRAKIMAGTGSNCTRTAIQSTREAELIGVDGILQVVPYYNKPSQDGIYAHFKAVADSTSLPVLLYNIPGRTGVNMLPETMARLADIPTIIGVKEAAGRVEQVQAIRKLCPDSFLVYSGDDALTLSFMKEGAVGVVSVASHVAGRQIRQMIDLAVQDSFEAAFRVHHALLPVFDAMFITTNPTPVKAALRMMGFAVGVPRLPMVDVTPQEARMIRDVLIRAGVLQSAQV